MAARTAASFCTGGQWNILGFYTWSMDRARRNNVPEQAFCLRVLTTNDADLPTALAQLVNERGVNSITLEPAEMREFKSNCTAVYGVHCSSRAFADLDAGEIVGNQQDVTLLFSAPLPADLNGKALDYKPGLLSEARVLTDTSNPRNGKKYINITARELVFGEDVPARVGDAEIKVAISLPNKTRLLQYYRISFNNTAGLASDVLALFKQGIFRYKVNGATKSLKLSKIFTLTLHDWVESVTNGGGLSGERVQKFKELVQEDSDLTLARAIELSKDLPPFLISMMIGVYDSIALEFEENGYYLPEDLTNLSGTEKLKRAADVIKLIDALAVGVIHRCILANRGSLRNLQYEAMGKAVKVNESDCKLKIAAIQTFSKDNKYPDYINIVEVMLQPSGDPVNEETKKTLVTMSCAYCKSQVPHSEHACLYQQKHIPSNLAQVIETQDANKYLAIVAGWAQSMSADKNCLMKLGNVMGCGYAVAKQKVITDNGKQKPVWELDGNMPGRLYN